MLEQTDYKTFEMRVFPIGPRAQQKVQITYYQELDVDNDWVTYVYPLATVASRKADQKVSGKFSLSFETKSEVPIVEMESPSHGSEFVIAKHTKNYAQASLEASGGDLGRDVVLALFGRLVTQVQPQVHLAGADIPPMTDKAVFRQNGTDVAIEVDRRRGVLFLCCNRM